MEPKQSLGRTVFQIQARRNHPQHGAVNDEVHKDLADLGHRKARVAPDLKFLEQALSVSIKGFEKNRLLFRFGQLDPRDPEKEATLALDVSACNYRVFASTPQLPSIAILATLLNESGDIYLFIKQVREKYRQMFQGPDT
ncbi:hypothetical protein FA15DRAFT_758289 [Coprinopsis marcescibilis]|uniref:Kinetochore protein SPC25 n=1 Tax=Coprinopsis marcescibilis TaxID=230819 RepID=A0A5C3KNW0_COPMA|nr:hypothetical protein FA15DRAFT_758289 [Coprinopsis marcescibilis]